MEKQQNSVSSIFHQVSVWLLFNVIWAIFQVYDKKYKLRFNDIPTLY